MCTYYKEFGAGVLNKICQFSLESIRNAEVEKGDFMDFCNLLPNAHTQTLALLLKNGVLSVSQPLSSREQATLPHLTCALGLLPAINTIRDTLNGSTSSSLVWSIKDGEGKCSDKHCHHNVRHLAYVLFSLLTKVEFCKN